MCGRYQILTEEEQIEVREIIAEVNRRFSGASETLKTGEIYPTNVVPVIAASGAEPMSWGMPQYNRPGVIINARSETAADKWTFKDALARCRVVVPTSGFFEWTHPDGKKAKDKYHFIQPNSNVLYLAGVWTEYANEDGSKTPRFVIMTTDANESMRPFHDRMPVYVAKNEIKTWINDTGATRDILFRPQPALINSKIEPENKAQETGEQMSLF